MTLAHHSKIDALSTQDLRNAAGYQQWRERLARHFKAVDPRTPEQRRHALIHFTRARVKVSKFLAYRSARIRAAILLAKRRGLRVIDGGR